MIAYGALFALICFVRNEIGRIRGGFTYTELSTIRRNFGYYLLLGLEFLIASDIIRSILEPSLDDLAILGGIVVIRTVLTYFLNKEIEAAKKAEDITPD